MTATLDRPAALPDAFPESLPGDTTTAAGQNRVWEAFLICCVLAENARPQLLGADASPQYVQNILRRKLYSDDAHLDLTRWRGRVPGGEITWRYHWSRAVATVQAQFPRLLENGVLPTYATASTRGLFEAGG